MSLDLTSTSSINSFINSYTLTQQNQFVSPLTTKQTYYKNLSSSYSTLSSKLDSLKTLLSDLTATDSSSSFSAKTANTSNSNFVTATVDNSAVQGSFDLRISQLAKSDVAVSQDLTSSTSNSITGTHSFVIKTGDGSGGEFTSNVDVTFSGTETNQTMIQKISDAINSDKAVVNSSAKTGTTSYTGGTSTFTIDLNGTTTDITVNGGGTYSDLIDEIVSQISANVSGVTAEKVVDSPATGDVGLKLTVDDSSKYISITNKSGFDLVSDLNIGVTKEKGASGAVTASAISPTSTTSQLTMTSKSTGLDYRITSLADSGTSTALSAVGLNLGASRPTFDQTTSPDTSGFLYADITTNNNQLNSVFSFNGLNIQRDSNTISDLVSGVTFNLKSVMQASDTTVNVAVGSDTSTIKSKIQDFITQFNDVYTYLKSNSTSASNTNALFSNDSNASSLMETFSSVTYSAIAGLPTNELNRLSQIGLSFDTTNGLSIADSSLLDQKLTDSLQQVENLFNSTNGVANVLYNKISPYLGTNGYLAKAKSSYDDNVSQLADRISSTQKRIAQSASALRDRYQKLQAQLITIMTAQQMFGTSVNASSIASGTFF